MVVDNASTDGSADFVRVNYPQCHLVENGENLGFGTGNNLTWGRARPPANTSCF
jgi:GT2 family glycosyltransferase